MRLRPPPSSGFLFSQPSMTSSFTFTHPLTRQWTCRQCLLQRLPQQQLLAPFRTQFAHRSTTTTSSPARTARNEARKTAFLSRIQTSNLRRHRKVALTATLIFVAGCAGLAFSERFRYLYMACERSGRVVMTLAINVNEYRKVLQKSDNEDYDSLLSECHKRCAERAYTAMRKNGSIFIKLGQHLSSMNYLLPEEWCETFVPLQDECPVSPFSSIDAMVKDDTGYSLDDYFVDFQREPIGAASLAQVHIAKLRDSGEKVAVKVQHPSMDDWKELDLALTRFTFRTLKRFFPEYDLTWLSDEMETSLPKELDFREEAQNAQRLSEYFSRIRDSPLIVPNVIWSRRRILVMEFLEGKRPDDLEYLDSHSIDRDEVSAALSNIFNEMIFGIGAPLHCDPHGGNIAIRLNDSKPKPGNFDVILYDHGLYRDIPTKVRRNYAHLWLAVINVDEAQMRKYAYEVAGIGDEEFPIFASAITGRDFSVVTQSSSGGVAQPKDKNEKVRVSSALSEGDLLEQLVQLLSKVPRIILLILKTNDLTRSLDENLHTRQGPVRTFMILAQYAARCVFQEEMDGIRGSFFWPPNVVRVGVAWWQYARIVAKLRVYEYYLGAKRILGLQKEEKGEEGGEKSGMERLQELM